MKVESKTTEYNVPEKGDILKVILIENVDCDDRLQVAKVLLVKDSLFFISKLRYKEDVDSDTESYKFETVDRIYTLKGLKEIFHF